MFEGLSNITKNKERKLIVFPFGFYVILAFFVSDFLMYFNIIICGVPPPYAAITELRKIRFKN